MACCALKAACNLAIAAAAAVALEAMSFKTCTVSPALAFHVAIASPTEAKRASKLPKALSIFAKASRAAEASKPSCWMISSAMTYLTLIFVDFRHSNGLGSRTFSANLRNAACPFF